MLVSIYLVIACLALTSLIILCFCCFLASHQSDDYFTCNHHMSTFITDEPSEELRLLSFYVFNITNALDVIRRGYKPYIEETGPYGYRVKTYKYDIYFNEEDSTKVTFKEFNKLEAVEDAGACERMYFRMDRNNLLEGDPCANGRCLCKDPDEPVSIVNPAFLDLIWKEGAASILSRFSMDVFQTIKSLVENDIPEAAKAHLVPYAMEEIYQFRFMMQGAPILADMYSNLSAVHTVSELESMFLTGEGIPATCDMAQYGVSICPWSAYDSFYTVRYTLDQGAIKYVNITDDEYPSVAPYLDPSNPNSFLNLTVGLPRWFAVAVRFGYIEYTFRKGFTMATNDRIDDTISEFTFDLMNYSFPGNFTDDKRTASLIMVKTIAMFLQKSIMARFETSRRNLVYDEWHYGDELVICAPYGEKCMWQWGSMHKTDFPMSYQLINSIIDRSMKVNTNPNSIYFDGNSPYFHNAYRFCSIVYYPAVEDTECLDIEYTRQDATFTLPAGFASINDGVSQINATKVAENYAKKSDQEKEPYIDFTCNISYLLHNKYREASTFHDYYTVNYLNLYRDPLFTHNFTYGNWEEIGYAQWGGGFVSYALLGVRALYNIKRNGMWHFGTINYFEAFIEYATWATRSGFPSSWIYDVDDAKQLLSKLADETDDGFQFRKNLLYASTTFIGDGSRYINEVGDPGEVVFVIENSMANFSCTGNNVEECDLIQEDVVSSRSQCEYIEVLLYDYCNDQIARRNLWVTSCDIFQTSMTSPLQGIQCDLDFVFGNPHPFTKHRGNIVSSMMYSMTWDIAFSLGLFCRGSGPCEFEWAGMFMVTTVNQLLFEGFSDASVLKYLELKHTDIELQIECMRDAYDKCGTKNYHCMLGGNGQRGFNITTKTDQYEIKYGRTEVDKYFAPILETTSNGTFIWRYAMNETIRNASIAVAASEGGIVSILNPIWTSYPAWHTENDDFHKFFQCSMRYYSGMPGEYNSCEDVHYTGTDDISLLMKLKTFRGNDSITFVDSDILVAGQSYDQFRPYLWGGFYAYPYSYDSLTSGPEYFAMENPVMFDKEHGLPLKLSQSRIDALEKLQTISLPFRTSYDVIPPTSSMNILARRFTQDIDTWSPLKNVGEPKDPYGMPYKIPIGMITLERFANFPLFIGTPHHYGNEFFGGLEFQHVSGADPDEREQMSFVDYDPVTGQVMRRAIRQQVNSVFFIFNCFAKRRFN